MGVELFWWNPEREGLSVDLFNNKYKKRLRLFRFPDSTYKIIFEISFFETFKISRSFIEDLLLYFEKNISNPHFTKKFNPQPELEKSSQVKTAFSATNFEKEDFLKLPNSKSDKKSRSEKSRLLKINKSESSFHEITPFCMNRVCSDDESFNEDFLDAHEFKKACDNCFMPSSESEDLEEEKSTCEPIYFKKSKTNGSPVLDRNFGLGQITPIKNSKNKSRNEKKYPKSNLDLSKLEGSQKPKHKLYKNRRSKVTSIRNTKFINRSIKEFKNSVLNKSDQSQDMLIGKNGNKNRRNSQYKNEKKMSRNLSRSGLNYNSDRTFSEKSLTFSEIEKKYNILIQNALNVSISQKEFSRISSKRTNKIENNQTGSCRTHNLSSKIINQSHRDLSKANQSSKHFKILCSPM